MSMENAILEHAAALREVAAAVRALVGGTVTPVELAMTVPPTTIDGKAADPMETKAAELASATEKRAAAAREAKAKDAQQNAAEVKPDAELEQAVQKVEADAAEANGDPDLAGPLDYAKDVRPVLLAAIKAVGKDKVQELVKSFGVDKADKVDPAKFGELLAGAQKLAA